MTEPSEGNGRDQLTLEGLAILSDAKRLELEVEKDREAAEREALAAKLRHDANARGDRSQGRSSEPERAGALTGEVLEQTEAAPDTETPRGRSTWTRRRSRRRQRPSPTRQRPSSPIRRTSTPSWSPWPAL